MEESILNSVKKVLGIGLDDDSFDPDVIQHINSALSNLSQLGIAPAGGISVTDENELTWDDMDIGGMGFLDNTVPILSQVKTLIFLRVRLLFDPPTSSYLLDSLQRQIVEHEWRLNVMREESGWTDPAPIPDVIEGGGVT